TWLRKSSGIWVGKPEGGSRWRVPNSETLAEGQPAALLEQVRAARPAWTADGARFAFPIFSPGATGTDPGRSSLWLGTLATRQVRQEAEGTRPFHDLHWSPDASRLGVVHGRAQDSFGLDVQLGLFPMKVTKAELVHVRADGSLHLLRPGEGLAA